MVAIQNQQTGLLVFLSINGTEITEHNRKYSASESMQVNDVETVSGRIKRFYKKNKKIMNLSFDYLPSSVEKTVDGRAGRDFIENLALNNPFIVVSYVDIPNGPTNTFNAFISNYREVLIRRDIQSQCMYYNISFDLEEA